jgi:hypothetical protein
MGDANRLVVEALKDFVKLEGPARA